MKQSGKLLAFQWQGRFEHDNGTKHIFYGWWMRSVDGGGISACRMAMADAVTAAPSLARVDLSDSVDQWCWRQSGGRHYFPFPLASRRRRRPPPLLRHQKIKEYIKMMRKEHPHEMYPHRVEQLRGWDFPFPNDIQPPKKVMKAFGERLQEFIAWKEANGSHPPQWVPQLGEWVKEQRKEYRKKLKGQKSYMSDEKIAKLIAAGFIFGMQKSKSESKNAEPATDPSPPLDWTA
jgi:hypothetical protein